MYVTIKQVDTLTYGKNEVLPSEEGVQYLIVSIDTLISTLKVEYYKIYVN